MRPAYYNEIDKFAAQLLRNLIAAGHIAPGDVDERSIEDVHPSDLKPYAQCHFFAGAGVWSYALRRAGWTDDRPIWTGSCPCQPFSSAGAGAGFADERHLWPAFFNLIQQCRPATVLGEQVASRDANPWIDLVQDDLEGVGYRVGAVPFPSAGIGAPHIRDRLYWVANTNKHRCVALPLDRGHNAQHNPEPCGEPGRLGNTSSSSPTRDDRRQSGHGSERSSAVGRLEHAGQHDDASEGATTCAWQPQADRPTNQPSGSSLPPGAGPGPVNGLWSAADWLLCRDGKWRPVEPGTFPLAHGATARVGRLRAYGNAINAEAARIFIEALMGDL
ncbi:DNA cytosine methyltransferase [Comamonas aquatica]|uniref:DNA cytosine methyltransferase n=1 Tax=Comamonas aquatica TaxID=225991 RepID=UPI00244901A4|nr:DNA cytosine methyltransferase [Comamonas aquatica]MDH0200834.1 DNA cytosine methyltransferase [Comamonas aquatica]